MTNFCLDCLEINATCDTCRLDALIRTFPRDVPVTAYLGIMRLMLRDEVLKND